jgi:hypothetical protein
MLADLQVSVRHLNGYDNITSWLEPHGELSNGVANIMIDTGPGADANYQKYLADKYKTIEALSQRWYGNITSLVSWQDVKVPEPAYFLGWSPEAISLNGKWRVNYDQPDNPAALATDFDDSTWGEQMNQSPKRALVRRHVKIDAGWLTKHPKPWLYVMDFNDTRNGASNPSENIVVSVNGKTLREDPPVYQEGHWTVLNVADILHAGDNTVAIRLPRGRFNYRVYFSGDEPKSYPNLGPERNAQWVDFINWCSATRAHAVRRGMQMIRQIDPDRGIVLMSPYGFENDMLQPAIEYGGDFHDTGSMGGWWNDRSPALTRGAGLPNSVEPGSGPAKPSDMLISFGNWITEGANAIDHFQSIGEVLWHPEIKKCFEDHQAMYTSIGRYHPRTAQIAALTSTWVPTLFDFPWSFRPATENGQPVFRGSGYISPFNCRSLFSLMEHVPVGPAYDSDAVNENMLERDQAGKYRVIIDTDTAVMTEATIDGIERYVRGGGIFVTYGETGRHSPEKPDTWPIDRLTGFHATDAQPWQGTIALAETQSVFPKDWSLSGNIQGHHFKPIAPDVQTLMTWNGGSTAVGLRPLGKGFVVTVGPWFDRSKGNAFFSRLFQWLKIDPIPARMETSGPEIFWRHFVSNNGLYDVWVNSNGKNQTVTGNLALTNGVAPAWYLDLKTGQRSTVTDAHLPVNLPPHEMAMYITPRAAIAESSADWFNLQRGWWQGTADPGPPLAPLEMKLIVDLTDDWAFQPVDAQHADVKALVAPAVDDKSWPRMRLGIFTLPDHPDVKHAVLRKHFRIPDGWNHGRILFRLPPSHGQAYLDGQALTTSVQLAAGSEHVVALDIAGKAARVGTDGCAWLTYHPEPVSRQDLSGPWEGWADKTKDWMPLTLPGKYDTGINAIRKVVVIDAHAAEGKTVILHLMQAPGQNESGGNVSINGHGMGPWRLRESNEINQNITPWVKPGQENEIKIPTVYGRVNVTEVSLEFHDKGTYP